MSELLFTARVGLEGVQYQWQITGPGQLGGDWTSREVTYLLPAALAQSPAQVTISVVVTDDLGNTGNARLTLTLTSPGHLTPLLALTPTAESLPPSATLTTTPVAGLPDPEIESLLQKAEEYFRRTYFILPKDRNAFELYKEILKRDPSQPQAREKIREITTFYKEWGDAAYTKQDMEKACQYYERYVLVADYLVNTLGDLSIEAEWHEIQMRLKASDCGVVTPTPESVLQITGVELRDENGRLLNPDSSDVYHVIVNQAITITVVFTSPQNHTIGVAWTAGRGKIYAIDSDRNTYIATKEGEDYIVITVWNKTTGDEEKYAIIIDAQLK